jgi:hypothetical protein
MPLTPGGSNGRQPTDDAAELNITKTANTEQHGTNHAPQWLERLPISGSERISTALTELTNAKDELDESDWTEIVLPWMVRTTRALVDDPAWSFPSTQDASDPELPVTLAKVIELWLEHGVMRDTEALIALLTILLNNAFPGNAYSAALDACERGAINNHTPAAAWMWNRILVEILEMGRGQADNEIWFLDRQVSALGSCADAICPRIPNAAPMMSWVYLRTRDVIRAIGDLATRVSGTPDNWMGAALSVCDSLIAVDRFPETVDLLRVMNDAVSNCGPSSESALRPGEFSRFREDAVYLLDLIRPATPDTDRPRK